LNKTRRRRGNIEPGVGKWVSYLNREKKLDKLVGQRPVSPVAPKGLYLYGNVGSGKLP
jgi:predicted ATPase